MLVMVLYILQLCFVIMFEPVFMYSVFTSSDHWLKNAKKMRSVNYVLTNPNRLNKKHWCHNGYKK